MNVSVMKQSLLNKAGIPNEQSGQLPRAFPGLSTVCGNYLEVGNYNY